MYIYIERECMRFVGVGHFRAGKKNKNPLQKCGSGIYLFLLVSAIQSDQSFGHAFGSFGAVNKEVTVLVTGQESSTALFPPVHQFQHDSPRFVTAHPGEFLGIEIVHQILTIGNVSLVTPVSRGTHDDIHFTRSFLWNRWFFGLLLLLL